MTTIEQLQQEGVNAFRQGDYETAQARFEAMIAAAEAENNPAKAAEGLNDLGVVRKQLGDLPGAFEALEKALAYYQDADDERGEAQVLGNLGMVEEAAGRYEDAVQSYLDSAAIFEELGDDEMAMYAWQALSRLKLRQKEWVSAIAAYEEGIAHLPDSSIKKKLLQKLLQFPGKFM
ncbi:MAG: tetratricopeptide repeat protein, partial [Caldilineae bacterium]